MGSSSTPNVYQYIGNDNNDGLIIGRATTSKLAFYGGTPIVQRSGAAQATTAVAVSASFGATQLAALQECMNTFKALNLWKGSA